MKVNNNNCRGCATGRCTGTLGGADGAMPYSPNAYTPNTYSPNIGNVSSYPPVQTNIAASQTDANSQVSAENYQEMLSELIGSYIITELLIGVDRLVLRQGYLTAVGQSYYILYDPEPRSSTVCDIYSLKFVTFFDSRERPTTEEFERWLESLRQDSYVFDSTEG